MDEILKKRIEDLADDLYRGEDPISVAMREGFKAGARFVLSHQWISVEKALPNNHDYVIAGYKDNIFKALYCKTNNMWLDTCGFERDVDRWMPIPKFETKKQWIWNLAKD